MARLSLGSIFFPIVQTITLFPRPENKTKNKVSAGKHHDVLATTCIKFLTLVVGKQIHKDLFGSEETLTEIVKKIAIPNITMRAADEEIFEVGSVCRASRVLSAPGAVVDT